jgi:ribonuclease HI
VTVVSSFPLGEIIQCREALGRIAKWAVELMGETLSFAPQKAIKSQILVDFLAEWTDTQLSTAPIQAELWTMYFDGSLMKTGAGTSLLFISPLGEHVRYVIRLHFPASNNVAEYEALVNGLRIAIELGVRRLDARGDSQLVIEQVMKNSHCRDQKMEAYCDEVWRLEDKFYGLELNHIARWYNETADELAKIASGRTTVPPNVFSRDIYQPSVKLNGAPKPEETSAQPEVPSAAEGEALWVEVERNGVTPVPNWQTPYLEYLLWGELPLDKAEARRLALPRDVITSEPGLGQEQWSRTDSRLARGPPQAAGTPSARPRLSSGELCRISTSAKSPYHRPYRMRIQCRDRLTPYPDTRASVGKVEVTTVTSPLY